MARTQRRKRKSKVKEGQVWAVLKVCLMCGNFWLAEALTRAGRVDEARFMLEKILSYSKEVVAL